jgi:hypothetical protein
MQFTPLPSNFLNVGERATCELHPGDVWGCRRSAWSGEVSDNHHFNWDTLVPYLIHPVKVAIIEAMEWVDEPVSPRDLDRIFDEQFGVSLVSYHMRTLAEVGVVEKVRQRPVRGALQTFYTLSAKEPTSPSLSCE